jgi:hypothetical protein
MRAFTHFVRGRSAVASLESLVGAQRERRLGAATRAHRALVKEDMPWTTVLATMLEATIANATGDAASAEGALRESIERATALEMSLHAAAARHQLGRMLGGDAGDAMALEAADAMKTLGVRTPERYARMLLPGQWRTVRG